MTSRHARYLDAIGHMMNTQDTLDEAARIKGENEALLKRLEELMAKSEEQPPLSNKDIEKLRQIMALYESFQAFGRFASFARSIVLFTGSLLVGWFVLADNIAIIWHRLLTALGIR